jgi:L-alanine-DL-glutamate epimerase-like enolase superfamily enzyme
MEITNIECIPVRAPGRTLAMILIDTDESLNGVEEAGPRCRPQAIVEAAAHLRRSLIGQEPMRIERLCSGCFAAAPIQATV